LAPLLPLLVPQSVLETHVDLIRVSERRCGPPAHVFHRNYAWDDVENSFLARSAVARKGLLFGQHGGATFQLAAAPPERHMHRDGRRALSWGARAENVTPAADPHLEPLRDTHRRGGDRVLIVESLLPPYTWVYRFTSTPLGNQNFGDESRLVRFVEAVAGPARDRLTLKAFPGPAAAAARHPVLRALPSTEGRRFRPAPFWMRTARVTVCTYPDTPLIEAMVIGVPTLGLWDTTLWGMSADAAPYFEELERLGVVHSNPESAAAKLDEIYDSADAWWSSAEIAAARRAFVERFAVAGDWKRQWAAAFRELAG
jgi:putative transferase (TIGR04331 family)